MQLIKKIKEAYFKSPLYYIGLGNPGFTRIKNVLSYKREGSGEKGLKIILNKQFDYGGQDITVENFKKLFKRCKNNDSIWAYQINSFAWLRDLYEVKSDDARICARELIKAWIKENSSWSEDNWNYKIIGKRFFFLLSFYGFYGRSSSDEFKDMLFISIHKQEKHLNKILKRARRKDNYPYIQGIKGLIFANIYFSNNKAELKANLERLKHSLDSQVLQDGCHKSRSAFLSFKILRSLIDIEHVLKNSKNEVPVFLKNYIVLSTRFIKSILYKDKKLPVFNDGFEYDEERILETLDKINFRIKTIQSFPISGYEKILAGKTNVLISTATDNVDDRHYGVGSFEMQHEKKRIVINCGAYIHKEKWKKALQETDAHSAIIIDNKNNQSCKAKVTRRNNKQSVSVSIENSGYEENANTNLSRKILVSNDGKVIAGNDTINNKTKKDVVIRFHLHPDVSVSYTKNKKHLLLRVGKSSGWIFKTSEDNLSIEDSIYLGNNTVPQQTKQIVIREKLDRGEHLIQWMFEKQN